MTYRNQSNLLREIDRVFIGYDSILRSFLDDATSEVLTNKYPPYNIEQICENHYRITIAVAGFTRDELDVELNNSTLTVTGQKTATVENEPRVFVYRGIAEREFRHRFKLGEYIRAHNVGLQDGLLTIDLVREIPEAMRPRKLEIGYKE
jgi:molecular chaperone IbpA